MYFGRDIHSEYIRLFFEQPAEMLGILKAQGIGNHTDACRSVSKPFFGQFDNFYLNIFLWSLSGLLLEHISEVVGRQAELVCKIFHAGQTELFRQAFVEVSVQ